MNQEVEQYIVWAFKNLTPIQLINLQKAVLLRPDVSKAELESFVLHRSKLTTNAVKFSEEVAAGGIGIRAIHYPNKGDAFENHSHLYDHLTYLAKGSVIGYAPDTGQSKEFHAPRMIMTKAGVNHQFVANEDDTHMMCLHRTDELEERGIPFTVVEPDNLIGEE